MRRREIPWDKMRQEYIYTSATIRSLAAKYGCSKRAVDRRSVAEEWVELRHREMTDIGQAAHARIHDAAVEDKVRIYDATREAVDRIAQAILRASKDADGLFRHLVQCEHTERDVSGSGGRQSTARWTEDKVFMMINGRNLADIARALKDMVILTRVLDGIIDAPIQARLDIAREHLQLQQKQAGMTDDIESESGIALLPAVDNSLLDNALQDPDQDIVV